LVEKKTLGNRTSSTKKTARQPKLKKPSSIRVRGASTNNLQSVDIDIPHDQFVVITGPSGSGKSSLAIDTVVAESQRQYIESLSHYARQFLDQLQRPDVDSIEGLLPTLYIDQKPSAINPRSTVGTQTEIHDHLRVLFARVGDVRCFQCGEAIQQRSLESICSLIAGLPEGTKLMVLSPIIRGRKGRHLAVFDRIQKQRLVRVRVDGEIYDIESIPVLDARKTHSIEAVTDRIVVREGIESRLFEALQLAQQMSGGLVLTLTQTRARSGDRETLADSPWEEGVFNSEHSCPNCDISYAEIEPRTFSFNSPYGACETCDGMGCFEQFDMKRVLPDRELSIDLGAVAAWKSHTKKSRDKLVSQLRPAMDMAGITSDKPLKRCSDKKIQQLIEGTNPDGKSKQPAIAIGLRTLLEKEYATSRSENRIDELKTFRDNVTCQSCHGSRLNQAANSVFLGGLTIAELSNLSIDELSKHLSELKLSTERESIGAPLLAEIEKRVKYLMEVGLSYLTLNRATSSLSGGEYQRVRLSTAIGTGLTGVCYVLDEPSIGLHQRDNDRLIQTMRELQDKGNTLLVVEHDQQMMEQADWVIDVGPEAGISGGRVIAEGPPSKIRKSKHSTTGKFLAGKRQIEIPSKRRLISLQDHQGGTVSIKGATGNNLRDVNVDIPLGVFICVTGVSGSGKSTLINKTLVPVIASPLGMNRGKAAPHKSISGVESIDKLIHIDQSPIGRTARGCLATYSGVMAEIRKLFAITRDAKQMGFGPGRFSFNNSEGRCQTCEGHGETKIEMKFLPDLYAPCDACRGRRFNSQTLKIKYSGHSIADVLKMEVGVACDFFEAVPKIYNVLNSFVDVGLGYLALGQASTTLSGGEAQRVKLATELSRRDTGSSLYMLDEPTTGLHFEDIQRLIRVLDRLVEKGNTVIVIEHNLDVIKCADWLIDLGPEGGQGGGRIVAEGTPEQVAENESSFTGQYLKNLL